MSYNVYVWVVTNPFFPNLPVVKQYVFIKDAKNGVMVWDYGTRRYLRADEHTLFFSREDVALKKYHDLLDLVEKKAAAVVERVRYRRTLTPEVVSSNAPAKVENLRLK
jgi:hypothetical protein